MRKAILKEYSPEDGTPLYNYYLPWSAWRDIRHGYTAAENVAWFIQYDGVADARELHDGILELYATEKGMYDLIRWVLEYDDDELAEFLGCETDDIDDPRELVRLLRMKPTTEAKTENNTMEINEIRLRRIVAESIKKVLKRDVDKY
jgi:hypothetical protein